MEALEIELHIMVMSTYKVGRSGRQRMLLLLLYGVCFLALSIVLCVGLAVISRDIVSADLCLLQCYSFSSLSILYVLCPSQFLTSKDGCYCRLPLQVKYCSMPIFHSSKLCNISLSSDLNRGTSERSLNIFCSIPGKDGQHTSLEAEEFEWPSMEEGCCTKYAGDTA